MAGPRTKHKCRKPVWSVSEFQDFFLITSPTKSKKGFVEEEERRRSTITKQHRIRDKSFTFCEGVLYSFINPAYTCGHTDHFLRFKHIYIRIYNANREPSRTIPEELDGDCCEF